MRDETLKMDLARRPYGGVDHGDGSTGSPMSKEASRFDPFPEKFRHSELEASAI